MIGARVGALLAARNQGIQISTKPKTDDQIITDCCFDRLEIEDRDVLENKKDVLKFRTWPYAHWVFSFVLMSMAIFLIYIIWFSHEAEKLKVTFFAYFVISGLIIGSISSLYISQVTTVTLEYSPKGPRPKIGPSSLKKDKDKKAYIDEEGTLMVVKTNIIGQRTYACYCFGDIAYVGAFKRGTKSGGINTTHYVLIIGLVETFKTVTLIDTKTELRVKKSLLAVRQFLGQDLDRPLDVVDQTTS